MSPTRRTPHEIAAALFGPRPVNVSAVERVELATLAGVLPASRCSICERTPAECYASRRRCCVECTHAAAELDAAGARSYLLECLQRIMPEGALDAVRLESAVLAAAAELEATRADQTPKGARTVARRYGLP